MSLYDSIKTEPFKVIMWLVAGYLDVWLHFPQALVGALCFSIPEIFIYSILYQIPEDDGNDLMHTFFNPDREGWLWKQGGRYKSWKRRWFILNDNCLYYFEFTTDKVII